MAQINRGTLRRRKKPQAGLPGLVVFIGSCIALVVFIIHFLLWAAEYSSVDTTLSDSNARLRNSVAQVQQDTIDMVEPEVGANGKREEFRLQQDFFVDEDEEGDAELEDMPELAPVPEYHFKPDLKFIHYYKGKSGAVIEEMLMAHAYTFHRNATYGGACGDHDLKVDRHKNLLNSIGLKHVLPFACPNDYPAHVKKETMPKHDYHTDDTRIWTPEYVDYLKSLIKYPPKKKHEYFIAVHIRRGDVTPCRPQYKGFDRYLPNSHFLDIVEQYNQPGARVVVYSQSSSYESLDDFRTRGYEVSLDDELHIVWESFLSADVVILSRSEFSLVPSIAARGKVVYTPFWHKPLRGWEVVNSAILAKTAEETKRLQQECTK